MPDYRANFDAVAHFVNGGSISAENFRLDLPSSQVDRSEVARLFVQHLGLALVSHVEVTKFQIVEEEHRGSRGIDVHRESPAPDCRSQSHYYRWNGHLPRVTRSGHYLSSHAQRLEVDLCARY
jgi:hypothetical protein